MLKGSKQSYQSQKGLLDMSREKINQTIAIVLQ